MDKPRSSAYPGKELNLDDSFRLLELEAGSHEDPIVVRLLNSRLSESPPFEALSYVWGDPDEVLPIRVANHETTTLDSISMSVTVNCYAALKRLRRVDSPRTLWIDAICINQDLVPERNHQLKIAAQIYYHSARVVIYLGESANDSDEAMDWIREIDKPSDWQTALEYGESPKVLRPNTDMIRALFDRPWFGRIWVLQEARYAREAVVVCGDKEVDWDSFCAFRHWNVNTRWIDMVPYVIQWSIFRIGKSRSHRYLSSYPDRLLVKLKDTRHCGATEERDKLFAILPLLEWEERRFDEIKRQRLLELAESNESGREADDEEEGVQEVESNHGSEGTGTTENVIPKMNYNFSKVQVYTQLAKSLINDLGLSVLREVVTPTKLSGLPSWAPDWSATLRYPFIGRSRRGERHYYHPDYFSGIEWYKKNVKPKITKTWTFSEYTDPGGHLSTQLHVRAAVIGTIVKLGDMCNVYENYLPIKQWESLVTDPKFHLSERRERPEAGASYAVFQKWLRDQIPRFVQALTGDDVVYESAIGMAMAILRDFNGEEATSKWEKIYSESSNLQWLSDLSPEEEPEKDEKEKPKRLLKDLFKNMGPSYEDQAEAIFYACHGKRFFVTDTGRIGLAPETTEVGDLIVVIKGLAAVFVVRPVAAQALSDLSDLKTKARTVSLVRDCFIQGLKQVTVEEEGDALNEKEPGVLNEEEVIIR